MEHLDIKPGLKTDPAPVEVGSFSHYVPGFLHPNGGWPWDFSHQRYEYYEYHQNYNFVSCQKRTANPW